MPRPCEGVVQQGSGGLHRIDWNRRVQLPKLGADEWHNGCRVTRHTDVEERGREPFGELVDRALLARAGIRPLDVLDHTHHLGPVAGRASPTLQPPSESGLAWEEPSSPSLIHDGVGAHVLRIQLSTLDEASAHCLEEARLGHNPWNGRLVGAGWRWIVLEVEVVAAAVPGRHRTGQAGRCDARQGPDSVERLIPKGPSARPVGVRSGRERDPHRDQVVRVEPGIDRAEVGEARGADHRS